MSFLLIVESNSIFICFQIPIKPSKLSWQCQELCTCIYSDFHAAQLTEILQNGAFYKTSADTILNLETLNKLTLNSGSSIYRFSRGWRNKTMNAGKRSIRETITHCK